MNHSWKISTFAMAGVAVASLLYASARSAHAEPQPHMQAALTQLEAARRQLDNATPDKGGHRVKALTLTSQAIEEVKKGVEFDAKR
jgi:hypothetical protein